MRIQQRGFGIRGIGFIKLSSEGYICLTILSKYILFIFKIPSKYLDVALKASIISSKRDIITKQK